MQPLLLTLDEGYLLTAAPPDLEHGIAPLGLPVCNNTEEAEVEWFCEDLQDFLELTSKRDVLFIIGTWNATRKSRDTWNNRQIWPWSTK